MIPLLFVPENGIVISQNTYDYIWSGAPEEIKTSKPTNRLRIRGQAGRAVRHNKGEQLLANLFGVYYKITDDILK